MKHRTPKAFAIVDPISVTINLGSLDEWREVVEND